MWPHSFVGTHAGVDVDGSVEGSTSAFGSIGGGSSSWPSLTIVKYSCRSYAAAASFAASMYPSDLTPTYKKGTHRSVAANPIPSPNQTSGLPSVCLVSAPNTARRALLAQWASASLTFEQRASAWRPPPQRALRDLRLL